LRSAIAVSRLAVVYPFPSLPTPPLKGGPGCHLWKIV